jgi:hypothetical protein
MRETGWLEEHISASPRRIFLDFCCVMDIGLVLKRHGTIQQAGAANCSDEGPACSAILPVWRLVDDPTR